MTDLLTSRSAAAVTPQTWREIDDLVLWLSTAMVDHANRVRPNPTGMKVGGHQASSASMVTLMSELYLQHLGPDDRVSVKPHASPVLHALEYLLGQLDEQHLTTLREYGGLQSYPSRLKDPVAADYSTGSVGIGATAPIWGAIAKRYVGGVIAPQRIGRQYSLVGDAELDEGAVWEAVLDPMVTGLGELVWIVDFNRQSLDRVLPTMGSARIEAMFAAAGWQVLTVKYGTDLEWLFEQPGGEALRRRIDAMSNAEYQRLLRRDAQEVVATLPGEGADAAQLREFLACQNPAQVAAAIRRLGGHDHDALRAAFESIGDTRPTLLVAYTVKGFGLPTEGHPQNHSALLTGEQMEQLADRLGRTTAHPWHRPAPGSDAAQVLARAAQRLHREPVSQTVPPPVPTDLGRTPSGKTNTQTALGRTLMDIARSTPEVGRRIVTVAPDVSSSTNLGGWVNKHGVWSVHERPDWFDDDAETILHWRERPTGQHIELGIAETNLVGLLGELGATWSRWGEPLLPIGVVYDPFVTRALEPWSFGIYAGGQSILVGTPSGVTLAAEGGAHQSIITPSIGLEQPGCTSWEPAFALDTEWCLLAALGDLGHPAGSSAYLRLSTRQVDQSLAQVPADPAARERRRRQAVAGGYALRRAGKPEVTIATMGAPTPEALSAAERLEANGIGTDVICLTSADLLFRAYQARNGQGGHPSAILEELFPATRRTPLVTILDGHPQTLAFLAAATGTPAVHLGVSAFGQSGDLDTVYRHHGLDPDAIVRAALDALHR